MNTTVTQRMTAADLERIPDDGFRYELVNGEIKQMTPPGGEHGAKTMRFSVPFGSYIFAHELGIVLAAETGFKIDNHNVRAPDCAFIGNERLRQYGDIPKGYIPFAPDVAVEVVSPGDTKKEVQEKAGWWINVGTHLVWVIDLKRKFVLAYYAADNSVTQYKAGEQIDGFDVVPGFTLPVEYIFS
ncbi:MAG: Uma2 family endonuclease [Pyrinomonadaceae bacterium MAG19_C2-C3]|nr:Uma2 family endonuclease [Pyrinomonadaceae bacterium MAG19_C2-C3]